MTKETINLLPFSGAKTLINPQLKTKFNQVKKINSWLDEAVSSDWAAMKMSKTPIAIRFVDPTHKRYGSIAYLTNVYHPRANTPHPYMHGRLRFEGRSSRPSVYSYSELVEWLPGYSGPSVWHYDTTRSKEGVKKIPQDRFGREIKEGDLCCYILYQFDGKGMANNYFGNVTRIDNDGTVWCKNIKLSENERSDEARVKDNKLITILTDDLMDQILIARLSH